MVFADIADDCDDDNNNIHPNATEICDGIDNDCDGVSDDGIALNYFFIDSDGDGYGNINSIQISLFSIKFLPLSN